ncbi:hypothetical protein LEN26_003875 [Aphanomyces euteiches]|nr:hypothetical protein LEN26_003875 [Aphanomyces euteiches]
MHRRLFLLVIRLRAWKTRQDLFLQYAAYHYYAFCHKTPKRSSQLTGSQWVQEKLRGNHDVFVEMFRMPRYVFRSLAKELMEIGALSDSPHVSAEEQLCMFLYFAGHDVSSTNLQERFQHSGETITYYLHHVVFGIKQLVSTYIRLPDPSRVHPHIESNPKYFPFFSNCRMAIDGTHIPVRVPAREAAAFHGRKGLTMNVLAACDFDLMFTYILAGWEGSASDSKVYTDALTKGLMTYPTCWDIADGGYALCMRCLTPYRGVRYHLKEFGNGKHKPRTYKELFNLRHAKLRNCVERIFGVVKKRFPILCTGIQYDYCFQVDVVLAVCLLHNFIRAHGVQSDIFDESDIESQNQEAEENERNNEVESSDSNEAKEWRDSIANAMWRQYKTVLRSRRPLNQL